MANEPISGLAAGAAISDTDLFPDVQTVGVGPVKVTAAQLKTYTSNAPTLITPNIKGLSASYGVQLQSSSSSAANWTLTLPTTAGSANQVLATNGSGVTSWVNNDAGIAIGTSTITGGTTGRVLYDNAGVVGEYSVIPLANGGTNASLTASNGGIFYSTASAAAILAGTATAGQMLRSGASGAPSWSTATFPSTATASGTVLRADGTNWVASTATFPNTATSAGTVLRADGTNWVASTATYPNTAAAGQVLYSSSTTGFAGSSTPTLGAAGATTGAIGFAGTTSGVVTVKPQDAAGTYNFNLPTTSGTAGQILTSGGGGSAPMTWSAPAVSEPVSVITYGADNTGATDCSSAFTSANAAPSLLIPSGTYLVSQNVTFTKNVTILPGAILNIAAGVTVYFNAGMQADITQIFNISSNLYIIPTGGSQVGQSVTLTWATPQTQFKVGSTIYVRDVVNSDSVVGNLSWDGDWVVTASTSTSVTFTVPAGISGSPYVSGGRIWQEAVVFNEEYFAGTGYPEWWGAVANGSTDCLAAIFFSIVACPITQLGIGTYLVSTTLEMNKNGRTLQGYSYAWGATGYGSNNTSKISINDGKFTCFLLGSNTVSTNNYSQFTQGMRVLNVSFTRNQTIDTSGPQNCAGVGIRGTLFAQLYYVEADEHLNGFFINGAVGTVLNNCIAFRSYTSTGSGADYFNGFDFDGNSGLTYAGSNASTYVTDCKANCARAALQVSGSTGFLIGGAGADTFLLRPETTSCSIGLAIFGSQGSSYPISGDVDIHVIGGVFDTFSQWGIRVYNTIQNAAISIIDCYAACNTGAAATAGIGIDTCRGAISLTNNQIIGFPSTIYGLYVTTSSNVTATGNMYVGCLAGGVFLNSATSCRVTDIINNYTSAVGNAAVTMTGSTRCYVAPIVNGGSAYWAKGVNMTSTGNTYNEINLTGIVPAAISGGSPNKLVNNAVQIIPTAPSVIGPIMFPSATAGTNVANGIMG